MKQYGYYVYMHKNKLNNKVYIGITSQKPNQRWRNGTNYYGNKHFNRAIHKYGWIEGFEHIILYENITKEEAENKEIELIKYYDSTNQNKGYNIEHGGNSTGKHSKETIKKISESQLGNKNHMYGKCGILNNNSVKIIRLNDRKIFNSESEVKSFASNVYNACSGKISYSGKFSNGEEMIWMYYDEYIKLDEYDILVLINKKIERIKQLKPKEKIKRELTTTSKPIMCLNSTMVFKSQKETCDYYGFSHGVLSLHLKGDIDSCHSKKTNENLIFKEIDYDTYKKEFKFNETKENIHINFDRGTPIEIFKNGKPYGVSPSINNMCLNSISIFNEKLEPGGVRYQINKSNKDYKGFTFKKISKTEYLERIGIL